MVRGSRAGDAATFTIPRESVSPAIPGTARIHVDLVPTPPDRIASRIAVAQRPFEYVCFPREVRRRVGVELR
jgi:hypothetical protein